jgi:endonuclease/exonuclease/phosphatase (EEP) superfamily protein YafD
VFRVTSKLFPSPANQNKSPQKQPAKPHKHRDWSGAMVGAAIGLAGLFGARLGQLWIGFDIFAQFWIQFFFIALASFLGMASPRYKTLVAAVILAMLVAGYSIWPYYVSNANDTSLKPLAANEKPLRVASFNSWGENRDFAAIEREVLRLDPDVMVLVEFNKRKISVLSKLLQKFPYQQNCFEIEGCDFAIVSKTPLSDFSAKYEWVGPKFFSAKLGPEFGNVHIYGLHTNRFPHQRSQLTQINAFIKYMEGQSGPYVLLGDFNATPFSRITQTLAESLGLERLTSLPTWSASYGFPQLAIDHIFVSQGIRALDHEKIGEFAGSDHFPIAITLAVPTK